MYIICLILLIICSYTDLRERGISLVLLAASLISCVMLMVCVKIFGNSCEQMDSWLIYEPCPTGILCALIPGMLLFIICRATTGAIGVGDVYVMLLLGLMPIIVYVVIQFFSLIFGNGVVEFPDEMKYVALGVSATVVILGFGAKVYGQLTEKRAGSDFLMLPASTVEKWVALVLVTCVAARSPSSSCTSSATA